MAMNSLDAINPPNDSQGHSALTDMDLGLSLGPYLTKTEPETPINGHSKTGPKTKSEAQYLVQFSKEGRLIRSMPLKAQVGSADGHISRPLRSKVTEFSRKSRMNLLTLVNDLRAQIVGGSLFITLTYPAGENDPIVDLKESKKHLDGFQKWIRYHFPNAGGIWKLEYTKRGTPHYHLLLFGVENVPIPAVKAEWARLVASENPHHRDQGAQVQRVKSQRQGAFYVAKYQAKEVIVPGSHFGRFWGEFGNLEAFRSEKVVIRMGVKSYVELRRLLDKVRKSNSRKPFRRSSDLDKSQRWFLECGSFLGALSRNWAGFLRSIESPPLLSTS